VSRDVLLLVDHRDGAPEPVTLQGIAQALEIASPGKGQVSGLLLCGSNTGIAERLLDWGLHALYVVEDGRLDGHNPEALSKAAAEAVRRLEPGLFVCGHTFQGMDVAPWVAAALATPLFPNCVALRCEGDDLIAERLVYGQAWQITLRLPWKGTVVATLARSAGSPVSGTAPRRTPVERLDLDLSRLGIRTRATGLTRPHEGEVDISRADVVVGVGRGVRDPSNLAVMEELAKALGGVVACSRPLVDLEWMPYERQIGVSGKSIRPKVYIACGISGAAQHLAGITEAEMVVAINQDPNAPIFRVAHYGVVADLLQVVPALTSEARQRSQA
jgi:electron transfer flavoprotein alpha subunit